MDTLKTLPGPQMINFLAMNLPFEPGEKQALLEASGISERGRMLAALAKASITTPAGSAQTRH
jgi:hypothetical protein